MGGVGSKPPTADAGPILLSRGGYRARLAQTDDDIARAQALRGLAFGRPGGVDRDTHDRDCQHVLIEHRDLDALLCCYRARLSRNGADVGASYAAQFYDLAPLAQFSAPMLELGRFCLHPDHHAPDILRMAWGAMTRQVDAAQVGLLFGCASFAGADPDRHRDALGYLGARHIGPDEMRPAQKAPQICDLATLVGGRDTPQGLPPLLRTYLGMGGWVSDHAVIDHHMDTLHVFCAVPIATIPAARQRLLRALAAEDHEGEPRKGA